MCAVITFDRCLIHRLGEGKVDSNLVYTITHIFTLNTQRSRVIQGFQVVTGGFRGYRRFQGILEVPVDTGGFRC